MRRLVAIASITAMLGCAAPPNTAQHQASRPVRTGAADWQPVPVVHVMDYHSPDGARRLGCSADGGGSNALNSFDIVTKGATNDSCL